MDPAALADDIRREMSSLADDFPGGVTVKDLCGYFGAPLPAMEAALPLVQPDLEREGVTVKVAPQPSGGLRESAHKGRRLADPDALARALARVTAGESAYVVATEEGVVKSTLYRYLNQGKLPPPSQSKLDAAVELVRLGMKPGAAAKETGASRGSVIRKAKALKDPAAVALGKKGGVQRASNLSPEQRVEIARRASGVRWSAKVEAKQPTLAERHADLLRAGLPDLVTKFPAGATLIDVAKEFSLDAQHTYAAVAHLVRAGEALFKQNPNGTSREHLLYVRGMTELPAALSPKQELTYDAICRRAVEGKAVVNYQAVSNELDLPAGSLSSYCYALERKGYIKRLTPYAEVNGVKVSPTYEVYTPVAKPVEVMPLKLVERAAARAAGTEVESIPPPSGALIAALNKRWKYLHAELVRVEALLSLYDHTPSDKT